MSEKLGVMKKGFTLLELLVVLGILSLVGVLVAVIFTRALRGTNKSELVGKIKQNGQSVLETMTSVVRNADNVVCPVFPSVTSPTPPITSITATNLVVFSKGIYTRYRFIPPNNTNTAIGDCKSANGCILQDNPTKQNDPDTPGKEETDPKFVTNICLAGSLMPRQAGQTVNTLTDTNPQTGVSVTNLTVTRDKPAGSKDRVTVNFDLKPGVLSPAVLSGQIDAVNFTTTVSLR